MTGRQGFDVHATVIGITVAAGSGLFAFLTLFLIARPSHVASRLASAREQIAASEALATVGSTSIGYPAGAVCHQSPGVAASALRQTLQTAASANQVTLAGLAVVPNENAATVSGLASITFTVEAAGRYDAVVQLLAGLSRNQPEIFIDQADLKSQTSSVTFKLSGRLFCLTSAPL